MPRRASRRTCPVAGAAAAIDFYTTVRGASERLRMATPGGVIARAEVAIGGLVIMIGQDAPGAATPARRR
jgi:PhnB protein